MRACPPDARRQHLARSRVRLSWMRSRARWAGLWNRVTDTRDSLVREA